MLNGPFRAWGLATCGNERAARRLQVFSTAFAASLHAVLVGCLDRCPARALVARISRRRAGMARHGTENVRVTWASMEGKR